MNGLSSCNFKDTMKKDGDKELFKKNGGMQPGFCCISL
jgi:hypothetical protein